MMKLSSIEYSQQVYEYIENSKKCDVVDFLNDYINAFNLWVKYNDICADFIKSNHGLHDEVDAFREKLFRLNNGRNRSNLLSSGLVNLFSSLDEHVKLRTSHYNKYNGISVKIKLDLLRLFSIICSKGLAAILSECAVDVDFIHNVISQNINNDFHYGSLFNLMLNYLLNLTDNSSDKLAGNYEGNNSVEMLLVNDIQSTLAASQLTTIKFINECEDIINKIEVIEKLSQQKMLTLSSEKLYFFDNVSFEKLSDPLHDENPVVYDVDADFSKHENSSEIKVLSADALFEELAKAVSSNNIMLVKNILDPLPVSDNFDNLKKLLYMVKSVFMLEYLLRKGIVFEEDARFATICETPLWGLKGNIDAVKILLKIKPELLSPYSIIDQIFKAVKDDNIDIIRELHALNVNIDVFDGNRHILLDVQSGEMVDCLVECGVNINASSKLFYPIQPFTALVSAWENGRVNVMFALMRHNASVHPDIDLTKSLFDAVENNDVDSVNVLLDMGVSIKCTNPNKYNGQQVLHLSTSKEMTELLLKRKANPLTFDGNDADSSEKMAPIHTASKNGRMEVVEVLLQNGVDINLRTIPNGKNALYIACEERNTKLAIWLISKKIDINICVNSQYEMFSENNKLIISVDLACKYQLTEVALALLKSGAKVNASTQLWMLLFAAVEHDDIASVKKLLGYGVSINSVGNTLRYEGKQVLHLAGTKLMAKLLIKKGANKFALDGNEQQSSERFYPLHLASRNGKWEVIEALLNNNVNINLGTVPGNKTALHIACEKDKEDIIELLIMKGIDITATVSNESMHGGFTALHLVRTERALHKLLLAGANINAISFSKIDEVNNGTTPFLVACESQRYWLAEVFLQYPSLNCNQGTPNKWPLDVIALSGEVQLFSALLKRGAQYAPNIQLQILLNCFSRLSGTDLEAIANNYTKILAIWMGRGHVLDRFSKEIQSFKKECIHFNKKVKQLQSNNKVELSDLLNNSIMAMEQHLLYIEELKVNFDKYNVTIKDDLLLVLKALVFFKNKFTPHTEHPYAAFVSSLRTNRDIVAVSNKKNINFDIDNANLRVILNNDKLRTYVGLNSDNIWLLCFAGLHSFGPVDHVKYKNKFSRTGALGDRNKHEKTPYIRLVTDIQAIIKKSQDVISLLEQQREAYCKKVASLQAPLLHKLQKSTLEENIVNMVDKEIRCDL